MERKSFIIILLMFFIPMTISQGGCESQSDSQSSQRPATSQTTEKSHENNTDLQFIDREQLNRLDEEDNQLAREREEHLKNSINNYNYILDN